MLDTTSLALLLFFHHQPNGRHTVTVLILIAMELTNTVTYYRKAWQIGYAFGVALRHLVG